MKTLIKKLLEGQLGKLLGLYPVFATDKEDQIRIREALNFQPNDVY